MFPLNPVVLTHEQAAIVAHDFGPALVFAVAGAGKSTAAVHRIERLVREKVFQPQNILATTFSRASARDLRRRLDAWPHCSRVEATTLHSVGFRIIRRAQRLGHYDNLQLNDAPGSDLGPVIYARAVARARRDGVYLPDSLDREDFLNYVSRCKGQLQYADLARAELNEEGLRVARQAENPSTDSVYLALYRIFEQVRLEHGMITFDDMLLTGWEALVRFPDVLREVQGQYRAVLVDEFQDLNLAQSEMLDLIAREHRNYMAIGDDDQTIYEWRGASVDFILTFEQRYGATKYYIRDNFRSYASHLALANRVIEHNRKREPKRLNLTRGFAGTTHTHMHGSVEDQAEQIVREIQGALAGPYQKPDIAVLVRMYAQTPFIEAGLIEARIPYVVKGSAPFYQRPELLVLLAYLRLGLTEGQLRRGEGIPDAELRDVRRAWELVYNRPTRFMSKVLADRVFDVVCQQRTTFVRALNTVAGEQDDRLGDRLSALAQVIAWLADGVKDTLAETLLDDLDRRLGYKEYLTRSGGLPETAEGRVHNVTALIRYARSKGTGAEFLQHLDYISFQKVGRNLADEEDVVTITTVFRAKGLQWPVVIVPNCNQGTYPAGGPDRLEEERRIFYVALTRPEKVLHLHVVAATDSPPTSPFLLEAEYERTLHDVRRLGSVLETQPELWSTEDVLSLVRLPRALHLDRYFRTWWPDHVDLDHMGVIVERAQHLWWTARNRNLTEQLGLSDDDLATWESLGIMQEEPPTEAFSDLERCVPVAKADVARPSFTSAKAHSPYLTTFLQGQAVRHEKLGVGRVERVVSDGKALQVSVLFESGGLKTLNARFAQLRPAEEVELPVYDAEHDEWLPFP